MKRHFCILLCYKLCVGVLGKKEIVDNVIYLVEGEGNLKLVDLDPLLGLATLLSG